MEVVVADKAGSSDLMVVEADTMCLAAVETVVVAMGR